MREQTGSDSEAATELFSAGRVLLRQNKLAEACQVFERSRQQNTTVAVLLNLGLCHQRLGQLATSYLYYRRAEVLATLSGDRRSELAHQEASELDKRRATLVLKIGELSEQLEVSIDGLPQPPQSWSRPMFIDAGQHTIRVRAPSRLAWQDALIVQDGLQHVILVPPLLPSPHTQAPRGQLAAAPAAALEPEPVGLHATRILALGVGGAGVLSLATGVAFGLAAKNAFSDSQAYCDSSDQCFEQGIALRQDAGAHATRATVLSTVGVIALASGVVLWLAAPASEREHVREQLARRSR
jgi:tetratricopeptide (TPR) repeat protein